MKNVLGIIIAFDNDNDLREITEHRTVGAVQWGGRYRIIDFMLSNMVNSGIFRVASSSIRSVCLIFFILYYRVGIFKPFFQLLLLSALFTFRLRS